MGTADCRLGGSILGSILWRGGLIDSPLALVGGLGAVGGVTSNRGM